MASLTSCHDDDDDGDGDDDNDDVNDIDDFDGIDDGDDDDIEDEIAPTIVYDTLGFTFINQAYMWKVNAYCIEHKVK